MSASYYALFHFLVDEATMLMLGTKRVRLRDCLARAFQHSSMKQTAVEFTKPRISPKLSSGFQGQPVPQSLIAVASAFVQLQEARHNTDYNRAIRFTRREALDLADQTEQAFRDWRNVRGSLQADTFLTGLLAFKQMQG